MKVIFSLNNSSNQTEYCFVVLIEDGPRRLHSIISTSNHSGRLATKNNTITCQRSDFVFCSVC